MPGQFINNSNSGGVTFINNSNSGQAIFTFAGTPPTSSLYSATVDSSGYNNSTDACTLGNPVTPLWATTSNPLTAIFFSDPAGTIPAITTYPSLFDGQYHKLILNAVNYAVDFAVDSTCANSTPC